MIHIEALTQDSHLSEPGLFHLTLQFHSASFANPTHLLPRGTGLGSTLSNIQLFGHLRRKEHWEKEEAKDMRINSNMLPKPITRESKASSAGKHSDSRTTVTRKPDPLSWALHSALSETTQVGLLV